MMNNLIFEENSIYIQLSYSGSKNFETATCCVSKFSNSIFAEECSFQDTHLSEFSVDKLWLVFGYLVDERSNVNP